MILFCCAFRIRGDRHRDLSLSVLKTTAFWLAPFPVCRGPPVMMSALNRMIKLERSRESHIINKPITHGKVLVDIVTGSPLIARCVANLRCAIEGRSSRASTLKLWTIENLICILDKSDSRETTARLAKRVLSTTESPQQPRSLSWDTFRALPP